MADYCTKAQLEIAIGDQYADLIVNIDDIVDEEPTTDRIAELITDKSKFIDDYISVAVPLPLEAANEVIKSICITLCAYALWIRKNRKDVPDFIRKDYDSALKLLADIQKGTLKLGVTVEEEDITSDFSWESKSKIFAYDYPNSGKIGSE
jgi:phage gp36-like protein